MESFSVYNILNYGVIGLGFLLAFLAYRLLGKEQQNPEPRKSILVSIHVFMIFSVVLCIIGFGSEYLRSTSRTADNQQAKLLQQYKDWVNERIQRHKKVADNLKAIADLPLIPEKYRQACKQAIDSLQERPPFEEKDATPHR